MVGFLAKSWKRMLVTHPVKISCSAFCSISVFCVFWLSEFFQGWNLNQSPGISSLTMIKRFYHIVCSAVPSALISFTERTLLTLSTVARQWVLAISTYCHPLPPLSCNQGSMEQTAGPLPTDDVSHVVYLGEEAAPLFPLAEHCELPSISADVVSAILLQLSKSIHICQWQPYVNVCRTSEQQ